MKKERDDSRLLSLKITRIMKITAILRDSREIGLKL